MHIQQKFIAGILTLLPLAAVWVVLKLIIDALSYFGSPWVSWTASTLGPFLPSPVSSILSSEIFLYVIGTIFTLGVIFVVGTLTTRVVGQQLLMSFEGMLAKVPFVHMIYSSTKKVISALQTKQDNVQRVCLIDFPNSEMRAIGFAMRTFHETTTGRKVDDNAHDAPVAATAITIDAAVTSSLPAVLMARPGSPPRRLALRRFSERAPR